ncbi:hypothetical protein BB558_007267 [Smittium angustum]|uniref:DDE Tnp4 domain-containing protein n=1 Tax=Smittium angustum TaxID=133377 RepID=A0A2U1IVI2_SMIAN|nr:hypothetical protein BB558_007267 [Smittium angustum]
MKFNNFPETALVIDASVQECSRFAANFRDSKVLFSGKHHKLDTYKQFLIKSSEEQQPDKPRYWSIMADLGYIGMNRYIPCILPEKGLNLSQENHNYNVRLASARIICENYYGRLKNIWGAARLKVRTLLELYKVFTTSAFVLLTNMLV